MQGTDEVIDPSDEVTAESPQFPESSPNANFSPDAPSSPESDVEGNVTYHATSSHHLNIDPRSHSLIINYP